MRRLAFATCLAVLLASCASVKAAPSSIAVANVPGTQLGLPPLPAYNDADHTATTTRRASQLAGLPGVLLSGTQCSLAGGNYAPAANGLLLGSGARGSSISFAMYSLPAIGQMSIEEVILTLQPQFGASPPYAWVAVSNYVAGRWQWMNMVQDGFAVGPGNQSASGTVHVLVTPMGLADGLPSNLDLTVYSVMRVGTDARVAMPPTGTALEVGQGKTYATIEDAYAAAPTTGGALIYVYAQAGNAAYSQPALQIYKPGITFWGVGAPAGQRVKLNGAGYNYTGAGSVPRAVFQFNKDADGCTVRGFEIYEAHNDSFNGAAVRINQANHVQVLDCEIHDCDMGMMSNGDASATPQTAADQLIEGCIFRNCGNLADPGYNHNLYLGGTSVFMRGCEVFGSLTGHNFKSRAHFNLLIGCYLHDSANRELDLVDDVTNTALPGSDTFLIGCVVAKDPACAGNRAVIHYGQDGGNAHNGKLVLVHNTITTPFISPVVSLSASGASVDFVNNLLWDQASSQNNQDVLGVLGGGSLANVSGEGNWLTSGFLLPAGFTPGTNTLAGAGENPQFLDSAGGNYALLDILPGYPGGMTWEMENQLPDLPGRTMQAGDYLWYSFATPSRLSPRSFLGQPDAGAYEFLP